MVYGCSRAATCHRSNSVSRYRFINLICGTNLRGKVGRHFLMRDKQKWYSCNWCFVWGMHKFISLSISLLILISNPLLSCKRLFFAVIHSCIYSHMLVILIASANMGLISPAIRSIFVSSITIGPKQQNDFSDGTRRLHTLILCFSLLAFADNTIIVLGLWFFLPFSTIYTCHMHHT